MDNALPVFTTLPLSMLKPGSACVRPYHFAPNLVGPGASALEVMTDLRFVAVATIGGEVDLEAATQKMIARGVRSLLVLDEHGDVVGILTSRDLIGDRPAEVTNGRNLAYEEIRVRDVMTPREAIEVIPLDGVLHASVGDVVQTLKHSGRQHALVVEESPLGAKPMIRGIFSATQIARQLGIALPGPALAHTFAEIDRGMSVRQRGRGDPDHSRHSIAVAAPGP